MKNFWLLHVHCGQDSCQSALNPWHALCLQAINLGSHSPSDFGMPSHSLPRANLFLSVRSFKCSLKLFQSALLTPAQKIFPLLRRVYPGRHQQAWCWWPWSKKNHTIINQKLCMTAFSQPHIYHLCLLVPFSTVPCYWKHKEKHYLCSWSFNLLSQSPEVSFDCPWSVLCYFITAHLKKTKMDNNLRAVQRQWVF